MATVSVSHNMKTNPISSIFGNTIGYLFNMRVVCGGRSFGVFITRSNVSKTDTTTAYAALPRTRPIATHQYRP